MSRKTPFVALEAVTDITENGKVIYPKGTRLYEVPQPEPEDEFQKILMAESLVVTEHADGSGPFTFIARNQVRVVKKKN